MCKNTILLQCDIKHYISNTRKSASFPKKPENPIKNYEALSTNKKIHIQICKIYENCIYF